MKDGTSRGGAETRRVKKINVFWVPLRLSISAGGKIDGRRYLARRRRDAESKNINGFWGFPAPQRLSGRIRV